MTPSHIAISNENSRSKRLKNATNETHERLDTAIMKSAPFASRERYSLFVTVQQQFHMEIDALYSSPVLDRLLPDIATRRRLPLIEEDLSDLGIVPAVSHDSPEFRVDDEMDIPSALGWLYVAEGSNLGAAFLLKEAAKLGLSETFGARHLAAHPNGRGLHWRRFTAALDAVMLSPEEETRAIAGGKDAFNRVRALVENFLSGQPDEVATSASPMSAQARSNRGISGCP